ncbi:hypothetical protein ACSBR1_009883 [Camellia fascicularis]
MMGIQEGEDEDGDEEEDIDINPLTMLLPDVQQPQVVVVEDDVKLPALDHQQLLQHHYLHSLHSTVAIRQLRSQGLSFQLWPAATTLFTLLDRHRSHPLTSPLTPTLSSLPARLRILELGSGTGLVGISAAATLGAYVTLTDLPHVLPNLQFNADANSQVLAEHGGSVHVAALGWGELDHMEAIGRDYDLILGSDVVYHDHLYDPLLETLRFFSVGGEKSVVFLMAHLRRWKKESAFFKRAKKVFDVEVIHADGPSDGLRVGVVVYRFAAKPSIRI